MAFTEEQRHALKAKLRYRHVKTRASHGTSISYVEGWHVVAEANRIFGYDSWDRQTLSPRCLWRETQRGETDLLLFNQGSHHRARGQSPSSCARASAPGLADPHRRKRRTRLPSRRRKPTPPSGRWPPLAIPLGSPSTIKTGEG